MNKQIPNHAVIVDTGHSAFARLKPLAINHIKLEDGFWKSRLQLNQSISLDTQYQLLESTGRLDNFRRIYQKMDKTFQGYVFNDSDVYKWLEAAAWVMAYRNDEILNQMVDNVITMITNAQDKNGYLNTYFSIERSGERWTNLREKHELYCAGHLIQAAIAHYRVSGEDKLLNVAIRLADHICITFGPRGQQGTCGHPEIEMALIELYRVTNDRKYLDLAELFIDLRGHQLLGGSEYLLDHLPFRDLEHLAGHAVRALYLCCGAADLVLEKGEAELKSTLERLWTNMVRQQIYITGGIGARYDGEAIGRPYELPNDRAYAESCAAIANLMWNWRMLQLDGNSRYADLLEWTLYNAVLPGISLDGKGYFYVNPLADDGKHQRQAWYECACCPPNICRTIAMYPGYMYGVSNEGVWLHLYAASNARVELATGLQVELSQRTNYPWDGNITMEISNLIHPNHFTVDHRIAVEFSIFFRIPGWLDGQLIDVCINDKAFDQPARSGSYLEIRRQWQAGDRVKINFPMVSRFIESHPYIEGNTGRIALARGPLLYCLEAADNTNILLDEVKVNPMCEPIEEFDPNLLSGIVLLKLRGKAQTIGPEWQTSLYLTMSRSQYDRKNTGKDVELIAIPYYAWSNRSPGPMKIWNLYE